MKLMAKEWYDISETGNWNVAKPYTELKIMKHLFLADEYELICTFGTSDLIEEFVVDEDTKNLAKIKALSRLHKTLSLVISNTKFAVKGNGKNKLTELQECLKEIYPLLPEVQMKKRNQADGTVRIRIREKLFDNILSLLLRIKEDMLLPLNEADLIFTSVDEFDPDKYKQEVMEDLINMG